MDLVKSTFYYGEYGVLYGIRLMDETILDWKLGFARKYLELFGSFQGYIVDPDEVEFYSFEEYRKCFNIISIQAENELHSIQMFVLDKNQEFGQVYFIDEYIKKNRPEEYDQVLASL